MSRASGDTVERHPGYVDLQINGIGSVDFWTADPDGSHAAGAELIPTGTTSYLATLPTGPLDAYAAALDRIAAARQDAEARHLPHIEGVHLEGPFLGGAPGAHPPELVRTMDVAWLSALLDRHPGLVRLVTLAPEADPGLEGVVALVERGVLVALGHSRCSYDEACAAEDAGASLVTHVFNGMSPMRHRDPGLAGAALDPSVDLVPTLIADGIHVHRALVGAVAELGCILVTDAVATGVEYFGQPVEARDGAVFLADGTLCGSMLTMDAAVRFVRTCTGAPWAELSSLASRRAAELLDLPIPGSIGEGGRVDLLEIDGRDGTVRDVWIAGEHVYGS